METIDGSRCGGVGGGEGERGLFVTRSYRQKPGGGGYKEVFVHGTIDRNSGRGGGQGEFCYMEP